MVGEQFVDAGPCPVCSRPNNKTSDDPIVFISSFQDHAPRIRNLKETYEQDEVSIDNIAPEVDLASYILRQVSTELDHQDRPIAAHILTSLDDDGFLNVPHIEICRYHQCDLPGYGFRLELMN